MSKPKTVTVELGEQNRTLEDRMATGRYASPSEVMQEALQALEREDALLEDLLDEKMQAAELTAAPETNADEVRRLRKE